MRKNIAVVLCLVLLFSLCGCESKKTESAFNKELLELTNCKNAEDILNWASDSTSFKIVEKKTLECEIDDGYWNGSVGASNWDGTGLIGMLWHDALSTSARDEDFLKIVHELTSICGDPVAENREENVLISAEFVYNGISFKVTRHTVEEKSILLQIFPH